MIGFLFFIFFLLIVFYNCYWKRRNLPPGPMPLPVLGNIISMAKKAPPQIYLDWRKMYGDVYTYWQGETPLVAVTDINLINEHFVKDGETFAGRAVHNLEMLELTRNGRTGIIFTDGDIWRELRRFSLHTLRDFGLGRNLMQERILDEVSHMISTIKEQNKKNLGAHQNIQNHIDISVGSIIMQLIFGYRYSGTLEKQEEFAEFKGVIDNIMKMYGTLPGLIIVTSERTHRYKNWPFFSSSYNKMDFLKSRLWRMLEKNVEMRRSEIDFSSNAEPIDYTEAFLRKQHELEKKGIKLEAFSQENLTGVLFDMWVAGQETTSNTLGWGSIYLINRPEIQKKLQDELDKVIGSDRLVTVDDKPKLPYLNAVIAEVQRTSNILPHNVHHRVTKDVTVNGHFIPKNTVVTDQISCVLYDESIFPKPLEFIPERHLDEKNEFKLHPALIPFGVGKRACLGEGLARMELFLFISNIFHKFRLVADEKHPVSEIRKMAGTVPPPEFVCKIIERF